jgi:glycerophosphoryl diester phosphodiesterase
LHLSGFWALARPLIVAHRGGAGDYPENTLLACEQALRNGADLLWLSVQLTRDGVPVLYRPADLAACTDGKGPVGDLDLDPVRRLNAGWQFQRVLPGRGTVHPYRQAVVPIPTLREALRRIPARVPLLLDLKSMPAAPLARAVAQVLDEERAWDRVRLYSTVAEHLRIVRSLHPAARLFEDRDTTRQRLVDVRLAQVCHPPPAGAWVGFELRRDLEVTERFTLGEGRSLVRRLPIQGRNRTIPVNRPPSPAGRGCPAARARIPPADSLSGTSWQQHHRERGVSPR